MNDLDLIAALATSPDFTVVRDSDHLADLLGVSDCHLWDTKIHGAPVTLIAQAPREVLANPARPEQGTVTEWDLTDGDETAYGTVRSNENTNPLALHRRMAQVARNYWKTH